MKAGGTWLGSTRHFRELLHRVCIFAIREDHKATTTIPLPAARLLPTNWRVMRSQAVWVSTVASRRLSSPTHPELRSSTNPTRPYGGALWVWPSGSRKWSLAWILSTGCGYSKNQVNSRRYLDLPQVFRTHFSLSWANTASWGPMEALEDPDGPGPLA